MYLTVHSMVIPEQSAQPVLARSCPSLGPFSARLCGGVSGHFSRQSQVPLVYIPRCLPPGSPYLSFYFSCLFLYPSPSLFSYQILVIAYLQRYLQSSSHRVYRVGPLICAPVFGHVHTLSCCLPFLIIPLSSPIYPSWLPPYLFLSLC